MTPTVTRRIVAMTVATAVFWKRVTAGAIVLEVRWAGALGAGGTEAAILPVGAATRTRAIGLIPVGRRARLGRDRALRRVAGASSALRLRSTHAPSVAPTRRPRPRRAACARGGGRHGLRRRGERTARLVHGAGLWRTGVAASGAGASGPAASGTSSPSVIPVIIGQQEKGPYRFVFSFLDPDTNLPVGTPGSDGAGRLHRARVQRARHRRARHVRLGDRGLARRVRRQDRVPAGG